MALGENEESNQGEMCPAAEELRCDLGSVQHCADGILAGEFLVSAQIRESCMCTTTTII